MAGPGSIPSADSPAAPPSCTDGGQPQWLTARAGAALSSSRTGDSVLLPDGDLSLVGMARTVGPLAEAPRCGRDLSPVFLGCRASSRPPS